MKCVKCEQNEARYAGHDGLQCGLCAIGDPHARKMSEMTRDEIVQILGTAEDLVECGRFDVICFLHEIADRIDADRSNGDVTITIPWGLAPDVAKRLRELLPRIPS